jgi:hypothetical protein
MKWILFTGTWRLTNKEVEGDVRSYARDVILRGNGIVTGGATGVDYFAMDEALKHDSSGKLLKVIIPTHLENYILDYNTNWCKLPVTKESIGELQSLLLKLKNLQPENLVEMPFENEITQDHYNLRHNEEVAIANEVYAFQVNNSSGTQDTINKAKAAGLPIAVHKKYTIEE